MKPSLLLITGWAYGSAAMQPLADALSSDFTTRILSGAQVLDQEPLPPADAVIGWSMGGMLAGERLPASCKKLVLLSSTARFCSTDEYPCGVHEKVLRRMILQLNRSPAAVLADFYQRAGLTPAEPYPELSQQQLVDGLNYLLTNDLRQIASQINIPVLLLHGEQDAIIPPEASDWLARHLPQATSQRIPSEGHCIDALAINANIRHFLS
ncbi:MAG: alpha/beta fold hydrolase [Kiritimatiellaceae bacterium]|nr:alpha/beta fold hydrolase [Kiritimatiellaceae bacterium]